MLGEVGWVWVVRIVDPVVVGCGLCCACPVVGCVSSACGSFKCVVVSFFVLDRQVYWLDVVFKYFVPLFVSNTDTFLVLVFLVEVRLCGRVVSCAVLCC